MTDYLVETSGADIIVPAGTKLFVNISGNSYGQKPVQELCGGEMVLIDVKYINKSLEQILPCLEKSSRYRFARDGLFSEHNGKYVGRFRQDLIRGVVSSGRARVADLEGVLNGDVELSREEKREIIYAVRNAVPETSEEQTRDWLCGDSVWPRPKSLLNALSEINPVFSSYLDPQSGIEDAYDLYTVVRQKVRWRLEHIKKKGAIAVKNGNNNSNGISTRPEFDIVLSQILQEVDEKYALVRVIDVSKVKYVEETPEIRTLEAGDAARPDVPDMKVLSVVEASNDSIVLGGVLDCLVTNYYDQVHQKTNIMLGGIFVRNIAKKEGWSNEAYDLAFQEQERQEAKEVERVAERIYKDMITGKIDAHHGLPERTAYSLFEYDGRVKIFLPPLYWKQARIFIEHVVSIDSGADRKTRRAITRELKKVNEQLSKQYGLDFEKERGLPQHMLTQMPVLFRNSFKYLNNTRFMARFNSEVEEKTPLFSKDDVLAVLKKYGLESLIGFIHPNNFVRAGSMTPSLATMLIK